MPKLFQINAALNSGSTGRIAEHIGLLAIQNGWEAYIAHGARYMNKTLLNAYQITTNRQEKIHALKSAIFDAHGLGSTSATKRLVTQIKDIDPDIIHLHNIHGYYLNYEVLFHYLAVANKPVVWTLHDCWPFTGHCCYFDVSGCEKWKDECTNCPEKNSYPKSVVLNKSERNFKLKKRLFTAVPNMTLVPVSDWLEGLIKESFLKNITTRRIYNGIDVDIFNIQNTKTERPAGRFLVLGVAGTWDKRKGLDDFHKLRRLLPPEYDILLIGLTAEQIKSLPDGITGVSHTNNVNDSVRYYNAADVFVNPTWEDNFPTTNIEALACGTPVVTYRTGGSVEAVDERTGRIVEKGDIESLAKNIISLCNDKEKEATRKICRERAVGLYDKNSRYNDYLQLYRSLLKPAK